MRKTLLLTLFISMMLMTLLPPTAAQALPPDMAIFDKLDDHLQAKRQEVQIPGMAIGVARGNEILSTCAATAPPVIPRAR